MAFLIQEHISFYSISSLWLHWERIIQETKISYNPYCRSRQKDYTISPKALLLAPNWLHNSSTTWGRSLQEPISPEWCHQRYWLLSLFCDFLRWNSADVFSSFLRNIVIWFLFWGYQCHKALPISHLLLFNNIIISWAIFMWAEHYHIIRTASMACELFMNLENPLNIAPSN